MPTACRELDETTSSSRSQLPSSAGSTRSGPTGVSVAVLEITSASRGVTKGIGGVFGGAQGTQRPGETEFQIDAAQSRAVQTQRQRYQIAIAGVLGGVEHVLIGVGTQRLPIEPQVDQAAEARVGQHLEQRAGYVQLQPRSGLVRGRDRRSVEPPGRCPWRGSIAVSMRTRSSCVRTS